MIKYFIRAMLLLTMTGSISLAHAGSGGDALANAIAGAITAATKDANGGQPAVTQQNNRAPQQSNRAPQQNNRAPQQYNRTPRYNRGGTQEVWNQTYNPPATFRTTSGVNYRSCAGKNCSKIGTMRKGTLVTVSKMINGWYEIALQPGKSKYGYVYKQYLTRATGNARATQWKPPVAKRPAPRRTFQQRTDTYVAIAYSETTGSSFTIWGEGDQAEGDRQAMNGCNQETNGRNDCQLVINGTNTCASLAAVDMGNYYAYMAWTDPNRRTAENKTLRDCREKAEGRACELLSTKCSWDAH